MHLSISDRVYKINPSLTLAIDNRLKQMIAQGIKVYGFGAGEPDFDTPEYIKEAAIEAINIGFTRYTAAQGTMELRKAICDKLERENGIKYNPDEIIVSSGAKHSLTNAFAAILNPGDEVIVPVPYWVSYTEIIKLNGGIPVLVKTNQEQNYKITKEDMEEAITPKTKAILLNTPSNPTGIVYSKKELEDIAELALKHNIYIVSDEIYERITYDGIEHVSIASISEEVRDITILINGMSKTYAMTGWRLGYAASNERVIKAMSSVQSHAVSHPSSITQYAATAALNGPQDDVKNMVKEFEKRRNYMYEKINSIKLLKCKKPQGAFYIYVDISKIINHELDGKIINTSTDLALVLLEKAKVAVIPGAAFGTDNYIRLSFATSMDTIMEGLDTLENFLSKNFV
ncbi:aspartate aminotransferase [Lutispora thermophila DSM 19022]|uniref:Aminotransferase n=1 Tax=Lutispora thermophila DSM 19022 TaxID=1122184 RepID=A0A1M6F9Q3_9FIRM|nr:pyridoxal phosphate-dependent aminotransferase [Lutispora thermophila]SHI94391.1 aspartate aminotransferase [Lutispora thermophila DSM 19022]